MAGRTTSICGLDWIRRKRWPKAPSGPSSRVSLVDLFCGCGGLTLGVWEAARLAGRTLDVRLAVDTSEDALNVYRANFRVPEQVARQIDIRKIFTGAPGSRLRSAELAARKVVGGVDVLVAGPPCQGHSDLNNHTRRDDPRNRLYLKAIRGVEVLRPTVVLIENVCAVVHDKSRVVDRGLGALESMGYSAKGRVVRAVDLGLPQRRKRHILLAVKKPSLDLTTFFPEESDDVIPVSAFIGDLEDESDHRSDLFGTPSRMTPTNRKRVGYLFQHEMHDLPNPYRPPCHRNGHSYISMYGRLRWDQPAQTITTGFGSMGQGRFVHPTRPRMITPHEAARIQGFPDFFDFSIVTKRTALQEIVGNLVPPQIACAITFRLLQGAPPLSED